MSSFNKTAKDLVKTLKEINTSKPSGTDTKAEVIRVSGDTAWVHIPGSEIYETPVDLSIDVKKGDEVLIRISDGNAWITGNITAPPTDDTATKKLESKVDNQFVRVGRKSDKASSDAAKALRSANGKNSVYYSDTRPTGGPFVKGDTWFNSAKDNQINEWNGTTWVPFELGEDAIADLSITNAKIANGTIQAAKIGSCDVGSLTGGYINAGHIDTASLTIGGGTLGDKLSETDTELSDLSDTVDSFEDRIEAIYGVCNTPAGTAIKEVICDGFVPFVGAGLSVKFTYGQNTSTGTPQLKILDSNSEIILDTKDIQFNNSYVSAAGLNRILWTSNTTITFMYDGDTWNIMDKPGTWYVLTSTSSSAVKYITYSGILMVRGTKIFVKFINKNTATGYLKLNLGFGDMTVRVNNSSVLAEDLLASTTKGDHLQFMYDGEFGWEYQDVYPAKTATNYITQINDEGIFVSPANQSPTTSAAGNSVKIDGTGMNIYKGGTAVAKYGDSITIGPDNKSHLYITDTSVRFYDSTGANNTAQVTSNGLYIMDPESNYERQVAYFGTHVSLYKPGTTERAVYISHDLFRFGGFDMVAVSNGNDYLVSDYTTNNVGYRTWIRSAQETDKGDTWAFSVQTKGPSETSYVGRWLVKSNGKMRGVVEAISSNATTTKGTYVSSSCTRFGQVVQLLFSCKNSSSIAAGQNVYEGKLSSAVPAPKQTVMGICYYGAHCLIGSINTSKQIAIRNASSSAVTLSSSANCSFIYITNDIGNI